MTPADRSPVDRGAAQSASVQLRDPAPGIEVRRLTPADAPQYVEVRRRMLAESPTAFCADPQIDRGCDEPLVRSQLATDAHAICGAFAVQRLVATAGLIRDRGYKLRHRALIYGVWVDPEFRERGVGERVMQLVIATARSWTGVRTLYLSVGAEQSAARRLYERLGFVAWGCEPGMLYHAGRYYDEFHMHLMIES